MKQLKVFADTLTQEQKLQTHASVGTSRIYSVVVT